MAIIDEVWFATLTRNIEEAGSDDLLNLTINIGGTDVVDDNIAWRMRKGQGHFISSTRPEPWFESSALTDSSIRVGIRGGDAWAPQHIFIFGHTERLFVPLAIETDLDAALSTDPDEGHLSMPLRLVTAGTSTTVIRRLLVLIGTSLKDEAGTDSPVQLQISAAGAIAVQQMLPGTPQDDLETGRSNWYFLDVAVPFTRGQVNSVTLSILDEDAWLPRSMLIFGLDTSSGRPNTIVPLVVMLDWQLGPLSTDPAEGKASIGLPLV